MLSRCSTKALAALRDFDPQTHLNVPKLAAAIGSAEHDARDAVRELEYAGLISIEHRFPHNRRFVTVIAPAEPKQHRITIEPAGSGFSVRGAVAIASTKAPVMDAARALREAGAPDADLVVVAGSVISVSPTTIGAVLKPRKLPQARYVGAPSHNNA
jgi:hypothetical protein